MLIRPVGPYRPRARNSGSPTDSKIRTHSSSDSPVRSARLSMLSFASVLMQATTPTWLLGIWGRLVGGAMGKSCRFLHDFIPLPHLNFRAAGHHSNVPLASHWLLTWPPRCDAALLFASATLLLASATPLLASATPLLTPGRLPPYCSPPEGCQVSQCFQL